MMQPENGSVRERTRHDIDLKEPYTRNRYRVAGTYVHVLVKRDETRCDTGLRREHQPWVICMFEQEVQVRAQVAMAERSKSVPSSDG